jgi:hypothetical protein
MNTEFETDWEKLLERVNIEAPRYPEYSPDEIARCPNGRGKERMRRMNEFAARSRGEIIRQPGKNLNFHIALELSERGQNDELQYVDLSFLDAGRILYMNCPERLPGGKEFPLSSDDLSYRLNCGIWKDLEDRYKRLGIWIWGGETELAERRFMHPRMQEGGSPFEVENQSWKFNSIFVMPDSAIGANIFENTKPDEDEVLALIKNMVYMAEQIATNWGGIRRMIIRYDDVVLLPIDLFRHPSKAEPSWIGEDKNIGIGSEEGIVVLNTSENKPNGVIKETIILVSGNRFIPWKTYREFVFGSPSLPYGFLAELVMGNVVNY